MSTLLLRLAAPLQAWGLDDKFERRGTMREPTKSGVTGLLAAAMGLRRDDDLGLEALVKLRFGVRVDQPGQLLRDYHIVRKVDQPKRLPHDFHIEKEKEKEKFVTVRYYLADAVFLAGVEGDAAFLRTLDEALRAPVFPLYLGRRSCPPAGRVSLGIRDKTLEDALHEEPWQAAIWYRGRVKDSASLTLVMETRQPGAVRRRDVPQSFSQAHRKHTFRFVEDLPDAVSVGEAEHDPLAELEG